MRPVQLTWTKLGRIFNPVDFKLPNDCVEYAQSPQTLIFNDFIRIYFSTRSREGSGKFVSHIAYVDFSKGLGSVISLSDQSVISMGELGCFDEHGIFPINILKHDDKIFAYTCGWSRRVSVSVETGVGIASSDDNGRTFKKLGHGPILSSSLMEPCLVGDAFVRHYDGLFHMWYIFGASWKKATAQEPPARIYKIGHATSHDGVNWKKEEGVQIIPDFLNGDECQALPTVIHFNGYYHMFFCFREATDFRANSARAYRLGYAYSTDLNSWTRADHLSGMDRPSEGWDSEMMCYPHIFEDSGKVYLLYNGNEFGRFGFGAAVLR